MTRPAYGRLCRADREWIAVCIEAGRVPVENQSTGEDTVKVLQRLLDAIDEAWQVFDELSDSIDQPGQGNLLHDQGSLL